MILPWCRFAVKEAVIKAHPHLKLTFHDIVIQKKLITSDGATTLESGAPIAIINAGEGRSQEAKVSISHDGEFATAVCIGFEAPAQATGKARPSGVRHEGEGERAGPKEWRKRTGKIWRGERLTRLARRR